MEKKKKRHSGAEDIIKVQEVRPHFPESLASKRGLWEATSCTLEKGCTLGKGGFLAPLPSSPYFFCP